MPTISTAAPIVTISTAKPVQVSGTLTLMVSRESLAAVTVAGRIELPDIDVTLRKTRSSPPVATAKTQLDGKFQFHARPGTYRVCWKAAGIGSGCSAAFKLTSKGKFLNAVSVSTPPGLIHGKVLTADGRPCWLNDPFFKLDVSTRMSLLDVASVVVQSVRANFQGEYAFGGVKAGNRYTVRAECEKVTGVTRAPLGNSTVVANITLPNHAPRIAAMEAFDGSRGLTRAPSGAMIKVNATVREADQDQVEYLWRTAEGSGSIAGTNAAQQDWQLTAKPGLHSLYLMARDGKGGYAFKRFDMQVGGTNVGFSGRVIDETTQNPVAGATVAVSGVNTTTNTQGWFSLAVTPAPAPERYVLNIRHPEYALLSRIHDKEAVGNTYELIRAQISNHDPNLDIDVIDTGSSGPCGSPGGKEGKEARPFKESAGRTSDHQSKPCRHRGAHIVVPAGALVDTNQVLAQGPVKMTFATQNPARRALPGDYRALDRNNAAVEMLSFGAISAEFRDVNGKLVNLGPTSSAEVRIPISDEQQPSAKPTIAMWSYDEQQGLWNEEGQANLQNTAEGWMYIGKTKHFSEINMDVGGDDPTQATCVRLELGNSLSGWNNLRLRAYVSYAGTFVQVKETDLVGGPYHAIYRIPYAPPAPPPNTLRLELRGTYNGQQVLLLNNVINTDAPRPQMTLSVPPNVNDLWPPYPYTQCGDVIVLEADPVKLPQYGDNDATGRPFFLTGPYGTFLPPDGEQVATDYYNTIDPGNATNPTLSKWWTNHGFNGVDGSGGTRASYLNHNDLGFGRDMNCKTTGADLACSVTNYGLPDQNPDNANAAENKDPGKRGATVAMEYKASEPADRRVRFYVYAGGDPSFAGKLKFADLDGLGPKPVPHLCIVCHGGSYNRTTKNTEQARFREFDLPSFKYSGGRSWDYAPSPNTLLANELTAFADLNKMVRDVAPATSPIKPLIDNWYPGGFGPGTAPTKPAVPAGWGGQVNGYHNVYGQSCRTCHIARDDGQAVDYFYTFSKFDDFKNTESLVCDSPKKMPNAFVTYKNFWSDLQRIIDFTVLTTAGSCQ